MNNQSLERKALDAYNKASKMEGKPLSHENICALPSNESLVEQLVSRSDVVLEDYIPAADKPITFICVNLHIFQDSDGSNNYDKSKIEGFRNVFDWINSFHPNGHIPDYLGTCNSKPPLPQQLDSRIRFILNRIEFYQDDSLRQVGIYDQTPLVNAMLARDKTMDQQLNIFLTAPDTPQWAAGYINQFPTNNLNQKLYIHSFATPSDTHLDPSFFFAVHWSHELGHFFGLTHLYQTFGTGGCGQCDESCFFYLYDIFGCSPTQVCPLPGGSNNNIMGGGPSWSISTLQIAIMHYALQHWSTGQYAIDCCCPRCVAFTGKIGRHKSQGPQEFLTYEYVLANEGWAWDKSTFTCPVDGTYHFSLSFQKDSLIDGGTSNDVWIKLWADTDLLGTAWSEKAGSESNRIWWFWRSKPQEGRRDSVGFSLNVSLKKGTLVRTELGSHNQEKRNLVDVIFSGHLLCSKCC